MRVNDKGAGNMDSSMGATTVALANAAAITGEEERVGEGWWW